MFRNYEKPSGVYCAGLFTEQDVKPVRVSQKKLNNVCTDTTIVLDENEIVYLKEND